MATIDNKNNIDPDNTQIKDYFSGGSGSTGGVLVGKRHSEGGIKAINKATDQPIEMEGGEVVITRNAVSDNRKRQFQGQMLTNREILSKINESGGGVAIFEEGGSITPHKCSCSGNKYEYGGEMLSDFDIYNRMNEESKPEMYYREGGKLLDESILTNYERELLNHFNRTETSFVYGDRIKVKQLQNLINEGIIYVTESPKFINVQIFITKKGENYLQNFPLSYFNFGGNMPIISSFKSGGEIEEIAINENALIDNFTHFKGVNFKYKNQYIINLAIQELVEMHENKKYELTTEEKGFLGYYTGMGGMQKYGATGKGLKYEYYTPTDICKKMWGLAYKHGYKGGSILEPSCGIGEFFKYAPLDAYITAYEPEKYSYLIAKILFPNVKIINSVFEKIFIKDKESIKNKIQGMTKYDLIIGNPPYGKIAGYFMGMGEIDYTNSGNFVDYFITRGLDLLNKGGLLIYIIGTEVAEGGTPFLQKGLTKVKEIINSKAELIDAYRLPNGVFDTTDVLSDIVVFKKL